MGPNLHVQYHENVSSWETELTNGVTTWRRDWLTFDLGPIQYSDTNADGRIDSRFEQQRELAILAFDKNHDGVFDEQWIQELSNGRIHVAEVSQIQRRVPATNANEPSVATEPGFQKFADGKSTLPAR